MSAESQVLSGLGITLQAETSLMLHDSLYLPPVLMTNFSVPTMLWHLIDLLCSALRTQHFFLCAFDSAFKLGAILRGGFDGRRVKRIT